jgi:outer membrane protein assembly factor BamB
MVAMRLRRLGLAALALALALSCGGRTPLAVDDRSGGSDAGAVDVWRPNVVSPPRCGVVVPVGGIRFTAPRILGQVAIASDGTIFAPRRKGSDRNSSREVVAFDACGNELWARGDLGPPTSGYSLVARLAWNDAVIVTTGPGDFGIEGPFRFTTSGDDFPLDVGRSLGAFVGIPRNAGAAIVTPDADNLMRQLTVFDVSGAVIASYPTFSNDTSCAIKGRIVGCFDRALDLDARRMLWSGPTEIIDGTFRHATPSAIAGGRIYTGVYGISTYQFVARELRTGREIFRTTLLKSSRGQFDLLFGAPVIDASGTAFVYLSAHDGGAPRGRLFAVRRDGTIEWTYEATTPRERYFEYGTHVAGNGDIVYLAIGTALHAIDRGGRMRWRTTIPSTSTASPVLSPNGDLALHTDDDQLVVIATESAGVANSEWPALGGDERNANMRD